MSHLDWDIARFVWGVMVTVVTGLVGVYAWMTRRHAVHRSAIERVEQENRKTDEARKAELLDHQRRLIILEEAVRYAPNAADIHGLREAISQLSNQVARQEGISSNLEHTVARMNQYLMERSDK